MHELPITKGIYKAVMKHAEQENAVAVNRVVLEIGILRDFIPEIVQKYWDYIAKGSIADGARIEIKELNATVACGKCDKVYRITRQNAANAYCPRCGYSFGTLLSGNELRIKGIEIVRNHDDDNEK